MLLVDDSLIVQMLISAQLEEANFEVEVASDGEQALAAISSWRPSVVLTDLEMPGMDGLELLRRLEERAPRLPVIVLSGEASAAGRARAEDLGAAGYVVKSADGSKLLATLERVVEAAGQ